MSGNLPAVPDDGLLVGLEDFGTDDLVMPSLKLDHANGYITDSLSGTQYEKLEVVICGLIKSRILWPAEVEETKSAPLCRSYNHSEGYAFSAKFPWKAAQLKLGAYPTAGEEDEFSILPCELCPLKDWGSNPKGNSTPWCSEQYNLAVMQDMSGEGDWSPATLTLQRSAVKPIRAYLTGFQRAKTPAFVNRTIITVTAQKRGTVNYVVPSFAKGAPTDQADHDLFKETYFRIREWLQTPRVEKSEDSAPADDDDDIEFK